MEQVVGAPVGQAPTQDVEGGQLQCLLDPQAALDEKLDQRPVPEGTQLGADRRQLALEVEDPLGYPRLLAGVGPAEAAEVAVLQ
jgi:hypothetical protein